MTTEDIGRYKGDAIVLYFGGDLNSVDAYTFANSLVSFADTIRSINSIVNPGQEIDIRLEAVAPGSFKAVIRQVQKGINSLFLTGDNKVLVLLILLLMENCSDDEPNITISGETIVIHIADEQIISSKDILNNIENVMDNEEINSNLSQTFDIIERDAAIQSFGLSPRLSDDSPPILVERDQFHLLTRDYELTQPSDPRRRRTHRATLVVLKPWVNASNRKWAFEWNSVPISAYVKDSHFLEKVKSHEIRFGNGDALNVELEVWQKFDADRSIWLNDAKTYVINTVFEFLPLGDRKIWLQ